MLTMMMNVVDAKKILKPEHDVLPVHFVPKTTPSLTNSAMMTPKTVRRTSKCISLVAIACVFALWTTSSGQVAQQVDAFSTTPSSWRSHQPTSWVAPHRPLHSSSHVTSPSSFSFQQNPSSTIISRMDDKNNNAFGQTRSSSSRTVLKAGGGAGGGVGGYWIDLIESVFRYSGTVPFAEALGINALLFFVLQKKLFTMLTPPGFLHCMALGTMLWSTLGWRGWTYCVLYLFLGQLVTKIRFAEKEKRGLAESRGGRRGPENVWGSALTGLLCAFCSVQAGGRRGRFLGLSSNLFLLGYVASLSTKLADTFASEIGKAYGKTTFLITNFSRVAPGTEGAVSVEGTAAAAVGGLLLSLCGLGLGLLNDMPAVIVSSVAAFLATNVESVLGATLQDKKGLSWITNEVINFFNTAIGAVLAMAVGRYILGM